VQILACVLQILSQSEKAIIDKLWKRHAALVFVGKAEVIKASFKSLKCFFERRAAIGYGHHIYNNAKNGQKSWSAARDRR
jgi:hypothetical protein